MTSCTVAPLSNGHPAYAARFSMHEVTPPIIYFWPVATCVIRPAARLSNQRGPPLECIVLNRTDSCQVIDSMNVLVVPAVKNELCILSRTIIVLAEDTLKEMLGPSMKEQWLYCCCCCSGGYFEGDVGS